MKASYKEYPVMVGASESEAKHGYKLHNRIVSPSSKKHSILNLINGGSTIKEYSNGDQLNTLNMANLRSYKYQDHLRQDKHIDG